MARGYHSPLTGDVWPDVRPAIGTITGLANFLNNLRPRRKPPEGLEAALALATEAAGAYAGIPKITRFGIEGSKIAEAYDKANTARRMLMAFVDDGVFVQSQTWWAELCQAAIEWRAREDAAADQQFVHELSYEVQQYGQTIQTLDVPLYTRIARLAYWAAHATEKAAASNRGEIDEYSYAHNAMQGALAELDLAGVSREQAMRVERVWRFVVAAGRMPVSPDDDDLVDAFEAALMVGADSFARSLVRDGFGVASAPDPDES